MRRRGADIRFSGGDFVRVEGIWRGRSSDISTLARRTGLPFIKKRWETNG